MKVIYYNKDDIKNYAKSELKANAVIVSSITVNWRGCIAVETANTLKSLGLSNADLSLLSVAAMEGSARSFRFFKRTAGVSRGVL